MARRPDAPCAACGKLVYGTKGSLPPGERTCRACRRLGHARPDGSAQRYGHMRGNVRVDDGDAHWLTDHTWHIAHHLGRAELYYVLVATPDGPQLLHRLVMDARPGWMIDHANHDGLDNRRSNLRLATAILNQANQRPQAGRSSRFKGVDWKESHQSWRARIKSEGRERTLGYFSDEAKAAQAYNEAAIATWGDFACLNAA